MAPWWKEDVDDEVLAADWVHDDWWSSSARPGLEPVVCGLLPLLVCGSLANGTCFQMKKLF
jgi:hypothetical protein